MKTKTAFFFKVFLKSFCKRFFLKRAFFLLVAIFPLLTITERAKAREDKLVLPLSRGGSHIFFTEINTGYYYTDSNYTDLKTQSLKQVLGLSDNNYPPFFHYMNMDFSLGYAFTKWFEVEAFSSGFWFAQSGDGKENPRFSGLQINRAGLAFRSQQDVEGVLGFIPEFSFSIPIMKQQQNQTNLPITDDGSMYFTPALWFYGIIGEVFYPFIYTGFKWRSKAISSLLQWKLGFMLKGEMAELGVNSYGFWSVIRDKSSPTLGDRVNLLKTANAGSLRFLSTNPGVFGFMGWIAWHFPYVTLRLYGDFDINGVQYSKAYSFLASLIIEIGSKDEKVKGIFQDKGGDFEPQNLENEQAVQDIFENPSRESRLQEEAEQLLEEGEQAEEEKLE